MDILEILQEGSLAQKEGCNGFWGLWYHQLSKKGPVVFGQLLVCTCMDLFDIVQQGSVSQWECSDLVWG